ncbi:hypothetical protein GCM10010156_12300 [Planobispora rosea]|uniref:DUF885 domain-containing protein n=1 Tax=Planobispora rosea TaxID=35762 RepID=A0A8J3WCG3_PLARO|nr:DUF885 domain-containing protein [Planobispora rosea]GGS55052.1 hypothetical protein GCM10010156_12300 [Planobispora rosea]GIH82831.1 hypothetical protein Pro02_12390 [Planobispora rosea]
MTSPIFDLCDDYVTRSAALDPVGAAASGIDVEFAATSDYSPDGYAAQADLIRRTLGTLSTLEPEGEADVRAAAHLRERLEAELACHEIGEPLRAVQAPFGLLTDLRDGVDLLPHETEDDWRNVAARLAGMPEMLGSWRTSLEEGLSRGLAAARRQALELAVQAELFATGATHAGLIGSYGDGPARSALEKGAAAAYSAYAETARYLREEYAPRAAGTDAVGAERYAVNSRLNLGADIDLADAYEWGWAELARIEEELAAEAHRVRPGASVAEATAILDGTQFVEGLDAYRDWLQERHDQAIEQLHGTHFDIAEPLRRVDVTLSLGSTSGAAYYTSPSEDLSRPGRTWWPVGEGAGERFTVWNELTTVFHEGVPGHHLQLGQTRVAGESLSRFGRNSWVSGHGEGWALYAERLADELGWFTEPGTRLGMLGGSALRAARVVIDIGVHLDLPLPDGSKWTFDKACEVLRDRGRCEPHRVHAEVVRYFGWPGQAPSYKLGERAWLAAREEARQRLGADFDLRRWHTAALDLGPVGLASLADALRRVG